MRIIRRRTIQVERFNRTLLSGLRHFCSEHGKDWDQFSDAITYAHDTTVHRATNMSPMQLVLTRPPPSLVLANAETIDDSAFGPRQQAELFAERLKKLMETSSTRLRAAQARYKHDFEKHVRTFNTDLKVGDLVYVRRETTREQEEIGHRQRGDVNEHHKLRSKAIGPFPIVASEVTHVMILRHGHLDTILKNRVIRAPLLQQNATETSSAGQGLSMEDVVHRTTAQMAANLPRVESSNDAIVYPADAPIKNALLSDPSSLGDVLRQRPRGREEINPDVVIDDERSQQSVGNTTVTTALQPSQEMYAVDLILDHDFTRAGDPKYSVKWTGYDSPTLEPREYIPFNLVCAYHKRKNIPAPTWYPDL